ncbi:MAG: hypothetical protein AAB447_01650 [Patescibacteria group bacterium]
MNTCKPIILGIDFGDTIAIARNQNEGDTRALRMSEDPDFLNRQALPGAFISINQLVTLLGPRNLFIVSRCSIPGEEKIMAWLEHHKFWEQTGMKRENIRFCRERNQKGTICAELGITHFVDDRFECLVAMKTVTRKYRLSGKLPDIAVQRVYTHSVPNRGAVVVYKAEYNPATTVQFQDWDMDTDLVQFPDWGLVTDTILGRFKPIP